MNDRKYGPKIKGNLYTNGYKTGKQPDFTVMPKDSVQVTDEFLRYLVEALRADGVEPRIKMAMWENQDKNGNTSYGIELEAIKFAPQDATAPAPPPAPPPAPSITDDDIPF